MAVSFWCGVGNGLTQHFVHQSVQTVNGPETWNTRYAICRSCNRMVWRDGCGIKCHIMPTPPHPRIVILFWWMGLADVVGGFGGVG